MKLPRYIFIFILMLSHKAFACDCESLGAFLKVASETEFVALVKVTRYLTFKDIDGKRTPMSMEVEIIDIYKGKETRKTIIVWGDNGALCRPYLSRFNQGQYYVIAFYKCKTDDYFISNCGDYWLNADIKKQIAIGSVTENQSQITLIDLKEKLLVIDNKINDTVKNQKNK